MIANSRPTRFTDEDLKRLLDWCDEKATKELGIQMTFERPHLKALLVRLQASELVAGQLEFWIDLSEHSRCDESCNKKYERDALVRSIKDWRESTGKPQ